jgi:hypothetical protein
MAQTERAKCYYITIPGMIQGKISAERGKIAQNQPIRGMILADGGAAVGFREISLPLLYRIRRDTARDELPRPATSSAKSPQYSPSVHHQGKRATARPILSFRCFCLAKRRAIWYDEISRNRVLTP